MAKQRQEIIDDLKADLDVKLMQQWESGFRDGIDSCVATLELMADDHRIDSNTSAVFRSIAQVFREQQKNA